jgi:hypothetical protein
VADTAGRLVAALAGAVAGYGAAHVTGDGGRRTVGKDRRTGLDRRVGCEPVKIERRSGGDRRSGRDRRTGWDRRLSRSSTYG